MWLSSVALASGGGKSCPENIDQSALRNGGAEVEEQDFQDLPGLTSAEVMCIENLGSTAHLK